MGLYDAYSIGLVIAFVAAIVYILVDENIQHTGISITFLGFLTLLFGITVGMMFYSDVKELRELPKYQVGDEIIYTDTTGTKLDTITGIYYLVNGKMLNVKDIQHR